MGQYHVIANLDKRQALHPHAFGDGLKLVEFGCSASGTLTALTLLLGASAGQGGRGGGDPRYDAEALIGSWAGDRIAIVGDYAEPDDVPGVADASIIYGLVMAAVYEPGSPGAEGWIDVSPVVLRLMVANGLVNHEDDADNPFRALR